MDNGVSIRKYPYPYRAALAICSDLDLTLDRHVYFETAKFLNTTQETRMGEGVGLEVGNTIYFDMPPGQFSYWNTDDAGREMVCSLIRSGHIDCLHSYGDLAFERRHAGRALETLSRNGCKLEVWIDHSVAPSNFGADIMRGYGDVRNSAAYHADLTCEYGIKYVWRGRVTSVIGRNVSANYGGIYDASHPWNSIQTIGKEIFKGIGGRIGSSKYAMHGSNHLIRETRLRDGNLVVEFIRSNPSWGGVSHNETAEGLSQILSRRMLDALIDREGVCILYTHLGKGRNPELPIDGFSRNALALLAEYYREGKVLVTTTRRLLGYCNETGSVRFNSSVDGNVQHIDVITSKDLRVADARVEELNGLTIYVPYPDITKVSVNGIEVSGVERNSFDHTGRRSVSLPWRMLEYPAL